MGVVGIIPAAGKAERMDGLPKYLLPVPEGHLLGVLCERMLCAGAENLLIGANVENRGVIESYAPERSLCYAVNSKTMSETVLAARRWAGDSDVLFGMPDSYWSEPYIYRNLAWSIGDPYMVCVAVWPTRPEQSRKLGMVRVENVLDKSSYEPFLEITQIIDKPAAQTDLRMAWGAIAWKKEFWQYICPDDPHVGYALQRAMASGVHVRAIQATGWYWDCGTPDEYFKLVRSLEL